jgi:phage anti-repressor protein
MTSINLKDFLKTYTAISNKFIDNYYKFYELCENEMFGIDLEKIMDYLEYKDVKKFHERLKNTYELNKDYIRITKQKLQNKNERRVFYYVTLDCFEKICMMSRTPKAESVRDYFITLRKFINYYKNNFSKVIISPDKNKKYIYILSVDKGKNVQKLGRTNNIKNRMYSYATGKLKHPDINFILMVDDDKEIEKCAKIFSEKYKFKNNQELYKIDYDILKSIVFKCAEINKKSMEFIDNNIINENDYYVVYDDFEEKIKPDVKKISKSSKSSKKSKSNKKSKSSKKSKK